MGLDNGPNTVMFLMCRVGPYVSFLWIPRELYILYEFHVLRTRAVCSCETCLVLLNFHFDALMDPDPKILRLAKNLAFFF